MDVEPDRRASAVELLLVSNRGEDGWDVPGGGHEPGETFVDTALREVREETGVGVTVTGVWRARRRTFVHAAEPDRRLEMLTVWFDARAETTEVHVGDEGVHPARWFDAAPEPVADPFEERVAAWDGGRNEA